MKQGLDAPICLTWELTYACNLACVHCLSSSGQRDDRELSTEQAKAVLDELAALQVFYINIGGGEPMIRRDFFEIVEHSIANNIGVKFSTNGAFIDKKNAERLAAMDYLDIQISLDGTDAVTNDAVRGEGSYDTAIRAMDNLKAAGFGQFKISVVVTRHNVDQLDAFKALADSYGAQLRITRLRPAGRGADTWDELHPTNAQQRQIYNWLLAHGENVLTGDYPKTPKPQITSFNIFILAFRHIFIFIQTKALRKAEKLDVCTRSSSLNFGWVAEISELRFCKMWWGYSLL